MTADLALGDTVTFTSHLERRRKGRHHTWTERGFETPRTGMIVGQRTFSDGESGYEEYTEYTGKRFFEVYLVAVSLRGKPLPVLCDDVNKIPEDA